MENGETKPQIMARSRHIILMHKTKWNTQQQERAAILFCMFPKLEEAYNIYLELVDIFNKKSKPAEARLNLARWYNKVEAFGDDGFSKVVETFENHNATIVNYFQDRLTNHLRNHSMPKSRLSEHSSEESETSSSLCTGWLHCILD